MSFDRSKRTPVRQACEEGYEFEVMQPPGNEPTGLFITVRGPESEVLRAELSRRIQADVQRELVARKRGREAEMKSPEEAEAEMIESAIKATLGWRGYEDGGVPVPFSEAAARELYTEHPWVRSQVVREAMDLGNFVRSSATSSTPTPLPNIG